MKQLRELSKRKRLPDHRKGVDVSSNKKGNKTHYDPKNVPVEVRGDPIMLDRLTASPLVLRCVSASSYEEAVRVYGRKFSRCWNFRNFYYFEEAE